jgi:acylphosphatase
VFYRARVLEAAQRYALVGWVANRPDGTVFIDVQGPLETVQSFLRDVSGSRGLSDARSVRRIAELPIASDMSTFGIRHE